MKPFTDSRRTFWIAGIALLVLGFLTAAVLLPAASPEPEPGPDVRVPKMQNVPSDPSQKVKLEVEEKTDQR